MIGETLGPYLIERELGVGGMGKVYAATVTGRAPGIPTGTRVALKLVHSHLLETPGFFKRFLREADVGKEIQHENVVRTYDVDALGQGGVHHHFLVMEYVEGQTLRDLLVELDRAPEELCRHIGREVAKGLAAIHAVGVVHRDLKPENVLITQDETVKVMDLGVARLQDEAIRLSQTGAFVGSVQYAAPEQFGRGGGVDHRVDLHALGLLLYELGCGQQPYYEEDFRVALQRLLNDEPRRVSEINPQLSPFYEEVVHTLIQKNQDDRFQTADEVVAILEAGEEGEWWKERAKALRIETKQPLRRIRIVRETALYGRDAEIEKLGALFEQVKTTDGQVLLVEGEAGIGKTRLVDEFVGGLRQAGEDLNFLFGIYPPGGAASAGGAFSTAFREHLGPDGSAPYLTEIPLMVPAFDALLRGDATPTAAEPLTKESLVTCFVHATRAIAAERPTVLLIDDLQFAPEDARNLFSAIALAVPGHRVLLVGTVRPGVSQEWTANLTRLEHAQQMSLPRLGPKDLVHLLKDSFRSERLATELGLQIALKSDGNPYYVFEIVRGLREGKFITQSEDGSWVSTQVIDRIQIPSSVMDLIQSRIADLTEEEKELLDVAACCGYEFDPILVGETLGLRRIPLLRTLGRIEKSHRLVRSTGIRCVFDHYQVQEALYDGLSELLRREYHGALADTLEEREKAADKEPKDLDGALCVELCEHFLNGARGEQALRYLDAALDYLEGGYLNDEVLRVSNLSLAAEGLVGGEVRVDLLLRKARLLATLGRPDEERATLEESLALAESLDDLRPATRALNALGYHLHFVGKNDEAHEVLSRAMERAKAAGDQKLEAAATGALAEVVFRQGRNDEARVLHERRLALAREIGDRRGEASAIGSLGAVCWALGQTDQAREYHERHLAMARDLGDRHAEGRATMSLGFVFWSEGFTAKEQEAIERQLDIARETGNRRTEASCFYNLGDLYVLLGQHDKAREHLEAALALAQETGNRIFEEVSMVQLGHLALDEGDLAEADRILSDAAALCEGSGRGDVHAAVVAVLRGQLYARTGRTEEARSQFEKSLAIATEAGDAGGIAVSTGRLARLPGGDAHAALAAFDAAQERLAHINELEARFLLWQATADPTHLAEAHRLLVHLRDHAPEDARETVIENVPLHRDIWAAAREAGL